MKTPPARTLVATALVVLGLAGVAGLTLVAIFPRFGGPGRPTTRTAAMELRRSAEMWRGMDAGERCPTLEDLRRARVIDPAAKVTDTWGTPFEITCTADETTIRSFGPDRTRSADDILVPDPDAH
jgi:hypothetical protein